jgi:hypothetical protein
MLGVANNSAACGETSSWLASLTAIGPAYGSIATTVVWPTALGHVGTTYAICAQGSTGTASASYEVLASTPPALSLSTASAQVGQSVTVQGTSFYSGSNITLLIAAPGATRVLATIQPFGDGTFSYAYTPIASDIGRTTLTASSASESGAPPALQASALLVIVAVGAPTATPAPTASATATIPIIGVGRTSSPADSHPLQTPPWLLLGSVMGGLLLLIGILLIIAIRQLRPVMPREAYLTGIQPATGTGVYPHVGSGSIPSMYGDDPRGTGGFARSDLFSLQPGPVGAVEGWDDEPEDSGPGPDWHPRPMGGTHARMPAIDEPTDPIAAWAGESEPSGGSPLSSANAYEPTTEDGSAAHPTNAGEDGSAARAETSQPGFPVSDQPPTEDTDGHDPANTNPDNTSPDDSADEH